MAQSFLCGCDFVRKKSNKSLTLTSGSGWVPCAILSEAEERGWGERREARSGGQGNRKEACLHPPFLSLYISSFISFYRSTAVMWASQVAQW